MVLIFQRVVTHYRRPILKRICSELNAVCCFGKKPPPGGYFSLEEHDFPHEKVNIHYFSGKKDTLVCMGFWSVLRKHRPKVIVLEFALCILSNWFLLLLKPFFKYKIILWSHGYNRKKGFDPKKNFSDALRLWWMKQADSVVVYGKKGKELITPFLKHPEKVFIAQNTLETSFLLHLRDDLRAQGKKKIKDELGIKEDYNLIFIGRLLEEKQPDMALAVYRDLKNEFGQRLGIHFVGTGPMEEQLKQDARDLEGVYFWGEIVEHDKAGELLFASDLMIMPGYVGLSVVHAFCFDVPVLSQFQGEEGPFHSPEIEYVREGETGFLVPPGDREAMTKVIKDFLNNQDLQQLMKNKVTEMVEKECTIEKMVDGLREAIAYATQ